MKQIIFITGNAGKFSEVKQALSGIAEVHQSDTDLVEIQSLTPSKIIDAKLNEAYDEFQKVAFHDVSFSDIDYVLVEDTSLSFDALSNNGVGFPGPLIKFFNRSMPNRETFEMLDKLGNTDCEALTVFGLISTDESREKEFFMGEISGTIVSPRGKNGFGWDEIFQIYGGKFNGRTLAELTDKEKNIASPRALAIEQLKEFLKKAE